MPSSATKNSYGRVTFRSPGHCAAGGTTATACLTERPISRFSCPFLRVLPRRGRCCDALADPTIEPGHQGIVKDKRPTRTRPSR